MNVSTIKEELLKLTKEGLIKRFSYGVYYLPGEEEPNVYDAIRLRYLRHGNNVFGFYTGENFITFALGELPSFDFRIEIMTNKATSGKKTVYMFSRRFTLRKPYVSITTKNVDLNSFLSYIAMTKIEDIKANYPILAEYAKQKHLSAKEVMGLSSAFPNKTASKLIATNLLTSLLSH